MQIDKAAEALGRKWLAHVNTQRAARATVDGFEINIYLFIYLYTIYLFKMHVEVFLHLNIYVVF